MQVITIYISQEDGLLKYHRSSDGQSFPLPIIQDNRFKLWENDFLIKLDKRVESEYDFFQLPTTDAPTYQLKEKKIPIGAGSGSRRGSQGFQGVPGTPGGPQGPQGFQGVPGLLGTQGAQGSQGTQGVQGAQGVQGTQGSQGTQGVQGSQGTQGVQGAQGSQGDTGAVDGSGTPNVLAMWVTPTTLGDSTWARSGDDIYPLADASEIGLPATNRVRRIYMGAPGVNVTIIDYDAFGGLSFEVGGLTQIGFQTDGRLYGTALHNNAGSVQGTALQYIASGTYVPVLTAEENVDSLVAYKCQWMRVGNVVTVSGKLDLRSQAANMNSRVGISLFILSDFTATEDCAGNINAGHPTNANSLTRGGAILANPVTDMAEINWRLQVTVQTTGYFSFTYEILP